MAEIEITTAPLDLGAALGLPSSGGTATRWRVQNRGPATVYRTAAATAPDPADVRGFRHASGSILEVRLRSDVPTWVWCGDGRPTLIVEDA